VWLGVAATVGVALALLYEDSYQQDGGTHFLFARWGWQYPVNFVSVWGRPLFTFLYSFPAHFGYPAAKLFTVVICLLTAWQTWRLAEQLKFERAELVIPFLFLQPSFLLLCADTMTEPLFALVFLLALRLHLSGRVAAGMLVASLLPLARPEGFFLGVLWGLWVLFDSRGGGTGWRQTLVRLPSTLLLASGMFLWWLAALLITHDPLWILHNWPHEWRPEGGQYGSGNIWWYFHKSSEIFGLILKVPFAVGLIVLLWRRRFITGVSAFVLIFVLHALMFIRGSFGSAGYPRYFVCVAPAIALIMLAGWNEIAGALGKYSRLAPAAALTGIFLLSGLYSLHYVDGMGFVRDAWAVREMYQWFQANEAARRPIAKLIWSQAYMCIIFDRDSMEKPIFSGDRERNLAMLRESPPGTLVFWDNTTGPGWHGIQAADLEAAGYVRLRSQAYQFDGRFFSFVWQGHGGLWSQEMHLFYKNPPGEVTRAVGSH